MSDERVPVIQSAAIGRVATSRTQQGPPRVLGQRSTGSAEPETTITPPGAAPSGAHSLHVPKAAAEDLYPITRDREKGGRRWGGGPGRRCTGSPVQRRRCEGGRHVLQPSVIAQHAQKDLLRFDSDCLCGRALGKIAQERSTPHEFFQKGQCRRYLRKKRKSVTRVRRERNER